MLKRQTKIIQYHGDLMSGALDMEPVLRARSRILFFNFFFYAGV